MPGGEEGKALQVRTSPGRPARLGATERRRLVKLLLKGPIAHGYRTNLWTTARIAEVIEREFGVAYHRDHIGRLMHSLNWSHQKPERRAAERYCRRIPNLANPRSIEASPNPLAGLVALGPPD